MSKKHTREVDDKGVEKFEAGLGSKKIFQASSISWSTVQSIIRKWKEYGPTANQLSAVHLSFQAGQGEH